MARKYGRAAQNTRTSCCCWRGPPLTDGMKKTDGLSVLIVDMAKAKNNGLTIRPIRTMMNHATTEVFFDNLRVPISNLIGEEGKGFRYILSGMNAERILIAAECIGDAKWFTQKSVNYAKERSIFGRPIGQNQGIQFPIAKAYANMRAAELMVQSALALYEAGQNPGAEANMAKCLLPMHHLRLQMPAFKRMAVLDLPKNMMLNANSARPAFIRWHQSRPTLSSHT